MKMDLTKAELRRRILLKRDSLSAFEREVKSIRICENIIQMLDPEKMKTIMLYRSIRSEVQLALLESTCKSLKIRTAYPVCRENRQMLAVDSTVWKKGAFGIAEPDMDSGEVIDPATLDLIICPCVAFDDRGFRLGMGGGYYDRFLQKANADAQIWAVAFEIQKVDSIPEDPWDLKMDRVVTEKVK